MNYINNYLQQVNRPVSLDQSISAQKPQNVQSASQEEKNVSEMPASVPDYNVQVPIAYSKAKDIKLSDDITAKCYKLANGQKVVILPKDGPTVLKTYVNTGSFNEPDNLRGISHYIEHNLFNGSEALGEEVFFDEINKLGAYTNASTSFSTTDYVVSSNLLDDKDLEKEIRLHAGMLTSPKFLIDKLEKEKKIVNSEINMYMSEDKSLGATQTIKNLFNIKSSSLDLVAGTTDNITNLTRDDVVNYFNNNYYPANMTTVITGEVDPDETMKLISKYFNTPNKVSGERSFEKMVPIEKTVRQDIISPKSEGAASVFIGFAGPQNNNYKEKILIRAMNILAGGLTYSRTAPVERKYGNNINFATERLSSRPQDRNMLIVEAGIPDEKVEVFLKDLYKSIHKLATVPPTDEELTAIKTKLKKSQDKMFESSDALNGMLGGAFLNGIEDSVSDFNKIVDSITAEDIMNIAKKYMDLNKAALTVVHPHKADADKILNNYNKTSAISFGASNKKIPIDTKKISTYRLPNNFDIVLNDTNTNTVEYKLFLNEKKWTPKQAAIANVLNDMIDNSGTTTKSVQDISKIADVLGISSVLSASDYGLSLEANFPVDNMQKALDLFKERIKSPNFNKELFKESVERLRDAYSTTEVSAFDKFYSSIYQGGPGQFSAEDKLKSLDNITFEDVLAFYKEIFEKSQGRVIVSAPFSKHPELKQKIFNSVGSYDKVQTPDVSLVNVYKPTETTEVHTAVNKKNQAEIIEGFKFKQSGNLKDKVCLEVLNTLLGASSSSRLFSDLREKRHLAYLVDSMIEYSDDIGVMELYIKTTTENHETGEKSFDNIKKSIEGFNENIEKLKTENVSDEELQGAIKKVKDILLSSVATTAAKTSMIMSGRMTPYDVDFFNKFLEVLDTITPDDIRNSANYIFKNKPVYSIAGTQASIDANKEFLDGLKTV